MDTNTLLGCILLMIIIQASSTTSSTCIPIITRSEWGAPSSSPSTEGGSPAPYVILHHTNGAPCRTNSTCKRVVQQLQQYHMQELHHDDNLFSFLIGGNGQVYEGRRGITYSRYGRLRLQSIAIALVGNYADQAPSVAMLDTTKKLIECLMRDGKVSRNHKLLAHKQIESVECPGNGFFNKIKTWISNSV